MNYDNCNLFLQKKDCKDWGILSPKDMISFYNKKFHLLISLIRYYV